MPDSGRSALLPASQPDSTTSAPTMKARLLLRPLLLLNTGMLFMALPAPADLIHRYSFNEAPGATTVVDSVGGANGVARVATVDGVPAA